MCDGPHVDKVRSRDPPWYPLALGMTQVVAAVSNMGPSLLPHLFPFIPVPSPLFTTPDEAGWCHNASQQGFMRRALYCEQPKSYLNLLGVNHGQPVWHQG